MWLLLLLCTLAVAAPPKVDADGAGNVITLRPLEGHTVGVFDTDGSQFKLPDGMTQPMWLVHPEAWRQAVAQAARLEISEQLVPELRNDNKRLESELKGEKELRSGLRLDLENSEATHSIETKMLRRSRTQWAIGGTTAGIALGIVLGVFAL